MAAIPLGPFQLDAPLAKGGTARIWRGVHAGGGVPVAVKVLAAKAELTEVYRAAFRDEVQAVAALHHPAIVTVFDHGVIPEETAEASGGRLEAGTPYLVMELATGGNARGVRGRMPWSGLRALLLTVLDALAHAHARGVVHRDLKPANLLLCSDEDLRPGPKLTDFGIAHRDDDGRQSLSYAGTPRYMAPEQLLGQTRDLGPWTDLYALGHVAWELATGAPPFRMRGTAALTEAQLHLDPGMFLPTRTVPDGLEAWLRTLLRKEPEARFQRAADAAWALQQLGDVADELRAAPITDSWSTPTLVLDATLHAERSGSRSTWSSGDASGAEATLLRPGDPAPPLEPRMADARRDPAPHPLTWRREEPPVVPALQGAGLALYGLRAIPLVDRHAEREAIWRALTAVREDRTARVAVLRGASGNGKSRLAQWMAERAHELGAATVLQAVHGPLGGPADGLTRMVARHLRAVGLEGRPLVERLEVELERGRIADVHDARALAALIAPGTVEATFADAEERFHVVRRVLARASADRPVIVWLDDAQWGGDALRFVGHLLRHRRELPVLALLTVQEEALADRPVEASLIAELVDGAATTGAPIERPVIEIPVRPLEGDDRLRLVQALLRLEPELATEIAHRTAGNPLFAVQLLGHWVERGLLIPGRQGFCLRPGAAAELPDDLHAVWTQRLERLVAEEGADVRAPLEIAATLGQEVDGQEWRAACAAAGVEIPPRLLEHLVARRLAWTAPERDGWGFSHGMLRESLVRRSADAVRWNAACAAMLRETGGSAERLGRHLLLAGEHAEAIDALLAGAEARREANQPREAALLLALRDRALDELGAPHGDRRRVLGILARSHVLADLRQNDEAMLEAKRAESLARRGGWPDVLARVQERLGRIATARGDLHRSRELVADAVHHYTSAGESLKAAFALRELGRIATLAGDLPEAERLTEAARLQLQALGSEEGVALCVNLLGDIARLRRDWDGARRYFEVALAMHERRGSRVHVGLTLHGLAEVQRLRGDLDAAEQSYRSCIAVDEAIGRDHSITRLNLGLCLLQRGDWAAARAKLEEVRRDWEAERRTGYLGCLYVNLLPALAGLGDWATFDLLLPRALELLDQTGMCDVDIAWPAQLAGDLARAAHPDRARRAYALAHAQWEALGDAAKVAEVDAALAALAG